MKPEKNDSQANSFTSPLNRIIDLDHPLVVLGEKIDWSAFDKLAAETHSEKGRPGRNMRLMVGLLYIKHAFDQSDESAVERWLEDS